MLRRFLRGGLLATLLFLLGVQALAAPESPLASMQAEPAPGFVTRITDITGAVYEKSGVLDQESSGIAAYSAAISSYELYYDGRLLMTVVPSGFSVQDRPAVTGADSGASLGSTGFYKTTFSIDDTREIFLTGLTESTLHQVQTELTASALQDRYFNLTNVDFIDAEKEFTEVAEGETASDANLCWAAATSNMLRFSGWGSAAGFKTEDDLFESFISAFTDAGGSYTYALDWFFNGNYQPQNWSGWSHLRAPGKSGAYLPDYAADSLYQTYEISAHIDNLRLVFDALERDCAVGISIGNYISWLRSGGHAITLWGYMRDTSASPYSKEAYPAIFISDSDSDKYDGALRRQAPNRLRVMMMDGMFDGFGDDSWELDYPSWFPWRIDSFTVLEPYSEEIEKDTSGTRNKNGTADLSVQDLNVCASTFADLNLGIDTISAGQAFKISGIAKNNSAVNLSNVKLQITTAITQNGSTVWSNSRTITVGSYSAYSNVDLSATCNFLSAGSYEATIRISADGVEEAYLLNNTRSIAFTVTAAAPDSSNASVSVSIPEFDGNVGGYGTLTLSGVDSLYPTGTKLTWSVYEKYGSGLYGWVLAYQDYKKPASVQYLGSGNTVQTCVVLRPVDPALACVTLNAGQTELLYHKLYLLPAKGSTSRCSAITYGEKALYGSEKLGFYISNFTTSRQSITVTPRIYALRDLDGLRVELWCGESIEMKWGDSTEKTPYIITSWETDLPIGQYTIYAETTDQIGVCSKKLSTLNVVSDKPCCSVVQTFRGDGRCAVVLACSGPGGEPPFGVEYRKDGQDETNRVSLDVYLNKGYTTFCCVSFEADAADRYFFRAFCGSDEETFYTDWYECPVPAAQALSLDVPKTCSAGEAVWEFSAPEDGIYLLTLSPAAEAEVYETARPYQSVVRPTEPLVRNFYLKKGESALLHIQTEDSYAIGFAPIPELELGKTTSCLYESGDNERCFRFTAPTDGIYLFPTTAESYAAVYISFENVTDWIQHGPVRPGMPAMPGMELKKGQTAYIRLQRMNRDYRYYVSVSRPAPEVSVSDDGVHVSYDPEFTGLHLIALYDTDGQLIDVRSVSVRRLEDHISAVLQGTRTGYVRVFQLDEEKHTPRTAAKQAELA